MEFDEDHPPDLVATATATTLASPKNKDIETPLDGASLLKVPITIVTGSYLQCTTKKKLFMGV